MNTRFLPSEAASVLQTEDDLAAIRVDRAQTELKHGRAVALLPPETDALLLVVAAVETLTSARLRWLASLGPAPRLLVTAERAQAMGWPQASSARTLGADTWTVAELQALAAVTAGAIDLSPWTGGQREVAPATLTMDAALTLAKHARLTPALVAVELPATMLPMLESAQVLQVTPADIERESRHAHLRLRRVSDARVPIAAHEDCTLVLFREVDGDAEHVAILVGQPDATQPVPVRLHSSCLTGDLLGSLRCDCGDQLRRAIDRLAEHGGVLLYLAQEGRGTGLANKLRAYRLQDGGLDTIDADRYLGFRSDERDFRAAAAMLQELGHTRIRLLTNNPQKVQALRAGGIDVVGREPLVAPVNPHNARYIQTKRERAGHLVREDEQE